LIHIDDVGRRLEGWPTKFRKSPGMYEAPVFMILPGWYITALPPSISRGIHNRPRLSGNIEDTGGYDALLRAGYHQVSVGQHKREGVVGHRLIRPGKRRPSVRDRVVDFGYGRLLVVVTSEPEVTIARPSAMVVTVGYQRRDTACPAPRSNWKSPGRRCPYGRLPRNSGSTAFVAPHYQHPSVGQDGRSRAKKSLSVPGGMGKGTAVKFPVAGS